MLKFRVQIPNRLETKQFFYYAMPIVLQSMIFTFNGVIDNFMVGDIPGATGALRAVNGITGIMLGGIYAVLSAGTIVASQYLTGGNREQYNQTIRLRIWAGFVFVLAMLIGWTFFGDQLIYMLSKADDSTQLGKQVLAQSHSYGLWRSLSWLIIPLSATYTAGLREIGKGKITLYSSIAGLVANFLLNLLLINVIGMDAAGAGIATLTARFLNMAILVIYCYVMKNEVVVPIKRCLFISREILFQVLKRWPVVILFFGSSFLIQYRDHFFTEAYPIGGAKLQDGSVTVLSITGSIYMIFLGMFAATSSTVSIFVGRQLGEGNVKIAKENASKLKVFNSGLAICLSIVLFSISFLVPYMTFLLTSNSSAQPAETLKQVRSSLWVIALFYPLWIWFVTSYYSVLAGGKTLIATIVDFSSSLFAILWLFILFKLKVHEKYDFWIYYLIFFLADVVKAIAMSVMFNTVDWAKNIVEEGQKYRKKDRG